MLYGSSTPGWQDRDVHAVWQVTMGAGAGTPQEVKEKFHCLEANIELLSKLEHPNIVRYLVGNIHIHMNRSVDLYIPTTPQHNTHCYNTITSYSTLLWCTLKNTATLRYCNAPLRCTATPHSYTLSLQYIAKLYCYMARRGEAAGALQYGTAWHCYDTQLHTSALQYELLASHSCKWLYCSRTSAPKAAVSGPGIPESLGIESKP